MRFILIFGISLVFVQKSTGQAIQKLSPEDSIHYQYLKQQMARYVNPNPDSSLYYVNALRDFSREKNYPAGLADGDYLHASYHRRLQQYDSAIYYFQQAREKATKVDYRRGVAVAMNGLCRIYYFLGRMEEAIPTCDACLQEALQLNDFPIIADTHLAIGNIAIRQNEMQKALANFLTVDSLHAVAPLRPDIIAAAYQSLGTVYQELQDYDKSEEYFLKGNEEFKKLPIDPTFYFNTTNWHLGEVYYYKGQLNKADSLLVLSNEFFTKIKENTTLAQVRVYLGLIRMQTGELDEAEQFLLSGFNLHKEKNNAYESSVAALELGNLYVTKKEPETAIQYLNEAVNIVTDNPQIRQTALLKLAEVYALEGDHTQAYHTLQLASELKDSLNQVQNLASIREAEEIYQSEKKEREIELLTTQNALIEQQNTNQRNLFIAGGSVLGLLLIGVFILYRNKQRTNVKLKEIDTIKSNFFANISHEFRTPLTLISTPIQDKLGNDNLDQKERKVFEMIQRNNVRLLNLVDQLLDLSKIDAGSMTLQVEPGDVLSFIRATADSFTYLANQADLQYQIKISQQSPESWFDRDALEKIVVNLLSNAIKYATQNGTVVCTAAIDHHQLMIEVKNTAKGFTKDQEKMIFEKFYQVDGDQQGTGIGLALVTELVNLHKGRLKVDNQTKGWVGFRVSIPMGKEAYQPEEIGLETAAPAAAVAVNNVIPADTVVQEMNGELPILLLVEDNADVRLLLAETFKEDYQILTANDGSQGVTLALEHIPDLIISDVMMPVKDGISLTSELKNDQRTSHVPIILLTAKAGDENELLGVETGADDYITKPFNAKILSSKVSKLIEMRRQLRDRYSQEVILKPKDIAVTSVDEQFLTKVQQVLDEKLIESTFTVESFSRAVAMSRMQLHRKLKALTGLTASEFIRSQRLKLAAKMLKESETNISQVGYAVGFNDPSYFARCFKEAYQITPSEFANQ